MQYRMGSKKLEKVSDARELLDMLEYLLANGGSDIEMGSKFPLGGVRLTVRHISRHLSELERMMREGSDESPRASARVQEEQRETPVENGANGSIASRIQMAPMPRSSRRGYTREIPPETFSDPQDVPGAE